MQIIIPIYLNSEKREGRLRYHARPLFHHSPTVDGDDLSRVVQRLSDKIRDVVAPLAAGTDRSPHDSSGLAQWNHDASIDFRVIKMRLELGDATAKLRLPIVMLPIAERRVAFSPLVEDQWFDIQAGESLSDRATQFYQGYFREIRRETPTFDVQSQSLAGAAWIDEIELDVTVGPRRKRPVDPLRALLGGDDIGSGADELRRVGRCLHQVGLAALADPIDVDDDLDRIETLLAAANRAGIMLVGPPGSGKTARIEGVVRRRVVAAGDRAIVRRQCWELSPPRLISGMSYLGQWQARVQAILKYAHRRDHAIVLDDLLGLLEAGKTRDSSMCVADMLAASLDVTPVRIIGELTPSAWAIFRRRQPKLAARMVVVPVAAVDRDTATEMLVRVRQDLEGQHKCVFRPETIATMVALYDRFESSSVLPGKVIGAMKTMAAKHPRGIIDHSTVIESFAERSGLQTAVIDQNQSVDRDELVRRVRAGVIGQTEAVERLIDRAMAIMKRVNDPERPLGVYLLVGPTGVGKTETAKTIAACLFDAGGLIRLDMNELSGPDAAARMIGTFDAPDGVLTAAIRRRPHAVLLLDEIEKAHPSVLDVLLPALGEGRLSDARGRVVDLTGLLILMTSNLGSRESTRSGGFTSAQDRAAIRQKHDRAIREFFRPEFFNRIDDVLHFDRLDGAAIGEIAKLQLNRLLAREGLQRRRVLIDVDDAALAAVARRGMDPRMGARSLKRQIERDLVRPAAETLAASGSDSPMLMRIHEDVDRPGRMNVRCDEVKFLKPPPSDQRRAEEWAASADDLIATARSDVDDAPVAISAGPAGIDPLVLETIVLRESIRRCVEARDAVVQLARQHPQSPPATPVHQVGSAPNPHHRWPSPNHKTHQLDQAMHAEIEDYFRTAGQQSDRSQVHAATTILRIEMGRLATQLAHRGKPTDWRVHVQFYGARGLQPAPPHHSDSMSSFIQRALVFIAVKYQLEIFEEMEVKEIELDSESTAPRLRSMTVGGVFAAAAVGEVTGSWLLVDQTGQSHLVLVQAEPIESPTDQADASSVDASSVDALRADALPPVRRTLHASEGVFDGLTGLRILSPMATSMQTHQRSQTIEQLLAQTYLWTDARFAPSTENDA